jgi:hypothetical protein
MGRSGSDAIGVTCPEVGAVRIKLCVQLAEGYEIDWRRIASVAGLGGEVVGASSRCAVDDEFRIRFRFLGHCRTAWCGYIR